MPHSDTSKSVSLLEALAKDDHHRLLRQLSENSLRKSFRQHMSQASDTEIESTIAFMKSELAADPYALLQPIEPGEAGAQFLYFKGYSLEAAMYLATLTPVRQSTLMSKLIGSSCTCTLCKRTERRTTLGHLW